MTTTTTTKPTASSSIKEQALALRVVRHKKAARVLGQARIILEAAKELKAIEKEMDVEAREIAGEEYDIKHTITFDGLGSIEHQLDNHGTVEDGAGIEDIIDKAKEIVRVAGEVASSSTPPPLPYEKDADAGSDNDDNDADA